MAKKEAHPGERLIASNKKAHHEYFILTKYEAGIVLTGSEVKSLRAGRANLADSYVIVKGEEAFLLGTHISPYAEANRENHDPLRTRKLLLHRREIEKLLQATVEKGLSVVPLRLYFKERHVKVEIAIARGKKLYDKRETEKRKELDREASAAIKHGRR
jgi:SsrA-binding protein